ncbi:MAG: NnrS family protein [Roseiarcus sp.]
MPATPLDASSRSAARFRAWTGAALFGRGFRPFFLAAGVWAVVAMSLWPAAYSGALAIPTAFSAVDWHAHEFLFGYGGAVVAGFLLTAIPNWTGRLPVAGAALAGLAGLWLAGRLAVFFSLALGRVGAGAIDVAFFAALVLITAREVIAGKNLRNLRVVALVGAFGLADVAFHLEAAARGAADYSARAALATLVLLILLIGGRVTPSFTANGLARTGVQARPAPFDRYDGASLGVSLAALAAWVAAPEIKLAGALLVIAGAANFGRLSRWQGFAARRDVLLIVLHAGFFLASLGFFAAAGAALAPAWIPYAVGVHVWAIGAIGVMTLAMMTRATLGHSGRPLVAPRGAKLAYLGILAALAARLAMAFLPADALPLMYAAAAAWIAAFVAFLWSFAPLLVRKSAP